MGNTIIIIEIIESMRLGDKANVFVLL